MSAWCAFPIGARIYVNGRDEAIVKQAFPEGSTSQLGAHYCVHFTGAPKDEQVRVPWDSVGVVLASALRMPKGTHADTDLCKCGHDYETHRRPCDRACRVCACGSFVAKKGNR